jgi:hypothetical protein
MTARLPPPVAERRFPCSRCDASAGAIQLYGPPEAAQLIRESFTSRLTARVKGESFEAVRSAIGHGDVPALFKIDLEYTPFYCPTCGASYCGAHWLRWPVFDSDGWHDSIRGSCPEGHERMLED